MGKSILVSLLVSSSCFGYGLISLRLLKWPGKNNWAENSGTAFAIGMGMLGWIIYWPGIFGLLNDGILWGILVPGWFGIFVCRGNLKRPNFRNGNRVSFLLLALISLLVLCGLVEVTTPPTDADSLAYHYALPKHFLAVGQIEYVPIAVQGAIPLLLHLTYLINLGLGGELSLTLWILISQIMMPLALYGVSRRWLSRNWSLTVVLVLMTAPVFIYKSGAGHVEIRTALFMLIAAVSLADGLKTKIPAQFVVAGLLGGFFMASKYFGIYAVAALLFTTFLQRNWLRPVVIFSSAALISGVQWYGWNWWHTGTPIFPVSFSILDVSQINFWNEAVDDYFHLVYDSTICLSPDLWGLIKYPFLAALGPLDCFGVSRTGFGPYLWLLLPGIAGGLVWSRRIWKGSLLFNLMVPGIVYYLLWFLIPVTQITYHLLPIYPLALLGCTVLAHRITEFIDSGTLLKGAATFSILLGLLAYTFNSRGFVEYHLSGQTREEYLSQHIGAFKIAKWVNENLSAENRIANPIRNINYFLEVPYFFLNYAQAQIEIHPDTSPGKFYRQLVSENVTHVIASPLTEYSDSDNKLDILMGRLITSGIAKPEISIDYLTYHSITLRRSSASSASVISVSHQ